VRVLFVCGADFRAPSEKQVLAFSTELLRQGHEVMISFAGDPASVSEEGVDSIEGLIVHRHRLASPRLGRADVHAAQAFHPDLIHAFNSRHPVVAAARGYSRAAHAPVLVHFEDDEWGLARGPDDMPAGVRARRLLRRAAGVAWPRAWTLSTRSSLEWTRRHAAALDAVTPTLAEHVTERLGRECAVVFPMVADSSGPAAAPELPPHLERRDLVMLTGALYPAHEPDVRIGMQAVAQVRARGLDAVFVHCGAVAPSIDAAALARSCGLDDRSASFLGHLPAERARALLGRAAVLIQPGGPTEFNRLRLPAKLHPYLASGRPTVTFATGFGELLEDRKEVLKTHTGDPGELADRIAELLGDSGLRQTLAANGPLAAARFFDARRNTNALLVHYRRALGLENGNPVTHGAT